jgi:hypothetical protein
MQENGQLLLDERAAIALRVVLAGRGGLDKPIP